MPRRNNQQAVTSAGAFSKPVVTGAAAKNSTKSGASDTKSIPSLVQQMKDNFLDNDISIVDGLYFNQFDLLKTIHFYLMSTFQDSETDENGNDRFFHNIILHRNLHTTKNIDLDTKDVYVDSDSEGAYWASWYLRQELMRWMERKDVRFGALLNEISENLPHFGSVVLKKTKDPETGEIRIKNVDLRNLILDPTVRLMRDSALIAERHLMAPQDIRKMALWDKQKVKELLREYIGGSKPRPFLTKDAVDSTAEFSLTDASPMIPVYEAWGWVPKRYLPEDMRPEMGQTYQDEVDLETEYEYVFAIVSGVDSGVQRILYARKADPMDFPYKDIHMRKIPGRWLGIGNTEMLIPDQIRMNELVNRFFTAMRMGSLHLFQTRSENVYKNLVQDAQDGDIIETASEIVPIATELRAFSQYQTEFNNIERHADQMANTSEIVTGESLPAATPFRLGATLNVNAARLFDRIREDQGIVLSEIFKEWIIPAIEEDIDLEHILRLTGSVDELSQFDSAYRKSVVVDEVKRYILEIGVLPTMEELQLVEKSIAERMETADRRVKIETGYFKKLVDYSIRFSITGENINKSAETESLGNIFQIVASNPAVLQDPNAKKLLGRILERSGISPLTLTGFVSAPAPTAATGGIGAASPAMKAFGDNPGDAGKGFADIAPTGEPAAQVA